MYASECTFTNKLDVGRMEYIGYSRMVHGSNHIDHKNCIMLRYPKISRKVGYTFIDVFNIFWFISFHFRTVYYRFRLQASWTLGPFETVCTARTSQCLQHPTSLGAVRLGRSRSIDTHQSLYFKKELLAE